MQTLWYALCHASPAMQGMLQGSKDELLTCTRATPCASSAFFSSATVRSTCPHASRTSLKRISAEHHSVRPQQLMVSSGACPYAPCAMHTMLSISALRTQAVTL